MANVSIKFLRSTAIAASYAAALTKANGANLDYGKPAVIKYYEGAAIPANVRLSFFVGIGVAGQCHEVGSYQDIQDVKTLAESIQTKLGDITTLTTTNKTSAVAAINELKASISALKTGVSDVLAGAGVAVDKTVASTPKVSIKRDTVTEGEANKTKNIIVVDDTRGVYATVDLSYNGTTGAITLTGSNGLTKTINIPVDNFVESGSYDAETNELVLVLKNKTEIRIPVAGLIDEWTVASTATLELIRDASGQPATSTILKGNVKLSATVGNTLIAKSDGLFVPTTDLTPLTNRVSALETTVGNASSGLVKTVADHTTTIADHTSKLATIQGNASTTGSIAKAQADAITAAGTDATTKDTALETKILGGATTAGNTLKKLEDMIAADLSSIAAGNGISVSAKASKSQTVSVKAADTSIVVDASGVKVGDIDGGEF